jgi:3',5'-cyclic AMP phosphodiesterase CpdA
MINFTDLVRIDENYPIIIKPNLGQPSLINLREYVDENNSISREIRFNLILLAKSGISIDEIQKQIRNNIYLQPILKSSGNFDQRRGKKFPLEINKIIKKEYKDFRIEENPKEEVCELWDIYRAIKKKGFGKTRDQLFKIELSIKDIRELSQILKEKNVNHLLCDLIHNYPELDAQRVNFHAIALFNKDWKNFQFIHASDSHIARRNDFIARFLKNKAINKAESKKDKKKRPFSFILDREYNFKEGFQEKKLERFRHGKFNFNTNLRLFISYVNNKVKENELDFVVFTGDLVDYVDPANYDDHYENNFQFLFDILLGINRDPELKDKDFENKMEIMAPIFTIVGNHDYRVGFYSIKTGRIYRKFGLRRRDIRDYKDGKLFHYLRALYSRTKFLNNYLLLINPNLNFKVNIGEKYSLIFLDTGMDSIANLFDLMESAPSTRGLKRFQIELLREFIKQSNTKRLIIFMHAPPLSPNFNRIKKWRLKRKFGLDRDIEWADLYEENITKYRDSKRLETILYFKYQTIMYRWARLIKILVGADKIIKKKTDLVLCGHTHTLKEFRIEEAEESEMKRVNYGFYFLPIYIKMPCKIYTSRYRDTIEQFKNESQLKTWFEANKPFIFHTQGLGPLSSKFKVKSPGFRIITVENNLISNVQVYSLQLKNNRN